MKRAPRKAAVKCSESLHSLLQTRSKKSIVGKQKQVIPPDPKLSNCFVVLQKINHGSEKNIIISEPPDLNENFQKSNEIVAETPKKKITECFVQLSRIKFNDNAQTESEHATSGDVYDYFSNSQENVSENLSQKNLIAKLKKENKITVVAKKKNSKIKNGRENNKLKKWEEKSVAVAVKKMTLRKVKDKAFSKKNGKLNKNKFK